MPQMELPIFPVGSTNINQSLAFTCDEQGTVVYFYGHLPVFQHPKNDIRLHKLVMAQLYINGIAKQTELAQAFGINVIVVKRATALYRKKGAAGFFEAPKRGGARILKPNVIETIQTKLWEGNQVDDIAEELGIKKATIKKAIQDGRLERKPQKVNEVSTKSERSIQDANAFIGMGATDVEGRVAARFGLVNGKDPKFVSCLDVPHGGVLLALPALLANGLLSHTKDIFKMKEAFYSIYSIFICMAFMALARIKSIERLRHIAPGEWGKLLGLDRSPEPRCMRQKIKELSQENQPERWSTELGEDWLKGTPDEAGVLYVDGHVRVYHGSQTQLPRHYVSRQKLCLRATTDYWVNTARGDPIFFITKPVDPGLVQVLENDVIPRLLKEVPGQPSQKQLDNDKRLPRFTVVFDREGYSPSLFKRLWDQKIAIQTYHKGAREEWSKEEFKTYDVKLPTGEVVQYQLAERGVYLGGCLWMREIRKLRDNKNGQSQCSMLSTNFKNDIVTVSVDIFSRWSQENYIKYMKENFSLDKLIEYETEPVHGQTKIVNPKYRKLDSEIKKANSILSKNRAKFAATLIDGTIEQDKIEKYTERQEMLLEEIQSLEAKIATLKEERKKEKKHITVDELPEQDRFEQLSQSGKHLVDTVKMIAYRAETGMSNLLRTIAPEFDRNATRTLLKEIYNNEVDLVVDEKNKILRVRMHHLATQGQDKALRKLCEELTATETEFPGSDLKLIYELID
jgi:hypothetical protein